MFISIFWIPLNHKFEFLHMVRNILVGLTFQFASSAVRKLCSSKKNLETRWLTQLLSWFFQCQMPKSKVDSIKTRLKCRGNLFVCLNALLLEIVKQAVTVLFLWDMCTDCPCSFFALSLLFCYLMYVLH